MRTRLASLVAALMLVGSAARAEAAAIIHVNTTSYQDIDNSECSIYEAVIAANTNASYKGCAAVGAGVGDTIVFDLTHFNRRINISITPLPAITEAVTIDGSIDGGTDRVELHGGGAPAVSGRHGITVTPTGFGTIIRNLVINNFADDGIFINADEVWVFGCRIGTDVTGTMAMPNQGFGIQVFGGNGNRIGSGTRTGSACDGDCNLISGANVKANVLLDLNSLNALVRGNFIGTDVTGTVGITPQDTQGIIDKGSGNRIGGLAGTTPGGPCTGDCNLVSGNNINGGIVLHEAADHPVVQGNFIGTDLTGTASISNGTSAGFSEGILSYANNATIGGTTPAARNVVSGNVGTGIQIRGVGSIVRGNYIGTDPTGTAAVPKSGTGVTLDMASSPIIGGLEAGAGNLISGASVNGGSGVWALYSTNAQIIGNRIGTAADGVTPLPNLGSGVYLSFESSNNFVGGASPLAGNLIAFNGGYGVRVDAGIPQVRSNTIRSNSIHDNDDGGIAFFAGANDNLAPPTILGGNPLHGTSCQQCTVEIFSDGDGQGAIFEGSVYTNDGTWEYDGALTGPNVTATNTDGSNNTSPFSAPFVLFSPTPTASPTPVLPTATRTASATRTVTATAVPPSTPTSTASATRSVTNTATPPSTPASTASSTRTATATAPQPSTPTRTASATQAITVTPSPPSTPTRTTSTTSTVSATTTPPSTPTRTASAIHTASVTATPPSTPTHTAPPTNTVTANATPSTTPPATITVSATPNASSTSASSASPTPFDTATASATQTAATPAPPACTGDCNGDGEVTINELISGVAIALGARSNSDCPAFANGDGVVDIAQLVKGVGYALNGC